MLANRRRKLYETLVNAPITETLDPGRIRSDRLLDEHAQWAEGILKSYGVSLSQASTLLPSLRTVYHAAFLSVSVAERLWQAGFRDVDVRDEYGYRPLTNNARFCTMDLEIELIAWFIDKGASISVPLACLDSPSEWTPDISSRGERRAVHCVAATVGTAGRYEYLRKKYGYEEFCQWHRNRCDRLDTKSRQCTERIFAASWRDTCYCACSLGGCLASTVFLKQWRHFPTKTHKRRLEGTEYLIKFLDCEFAQSKDEYECWLADEIIRFNTFDFLQLRHTCCKYITHWGNKSAFIDLDPEDVDEIRDEESESIELLEELMKEFQQERGEQDVLKFLEGYWATRMREVHRARGKVDLEKTTEMGVVWSDTCSDASSTDRDETGEDATDEAHDIDEEESEGTGENSKGEQKLCVMQSKYPP